MRADVVVVGAGPAGCVMARRLADAGAQVILVEAGDRSASGRAGLLEVGPNSRVVSRYRAMLGDTVLDLPRGRALGGSGAVNGGYCLPASPADVAAWGPDWPRRYAVGLARAAERLRPGLAPIGPVAAHLAAAFPGRLQAVAQARRGGRRVTAYDAWDPAGAGVRILTGTTVRQLRWAGGRVGGRCDGVVLARGGDNPDDDDDDDNDNDEISADEVILCAGSIGSAALLLGSGIGPDSGHPVGRSVQEHPEVLLDLPPGLLETLAETLHERPHESLPDFVRDPAAPRPELPALLSHVVRFELSGAPPGSADAAGIEVRPYAVPLHRAIPGLDPVPHRVGVALMNPVGRGTVSLGVGSGTSGTRGAHSARGARSARSAPGAGGDARDVGIDLADDPRDAASLAEATALVADRLGIDVAARRVTVSTSQHLSGAARIGEVVDDSGRVFGVDGLRVADASVLPSLPRRGPYYTVLAVAEALAAEVVAERSW